MRSACASQIVHRLVGGGGKIFGRHFDGLVRRITQHRTKLVRQRIILVLELGDALLDPGGGQLSLGHFDGQFETGLRPLPW